MEREKYVDESWKETADEQKKKLDDVKEAQADSAETKPEQPPAEEHVHSEECGHGYAGEAQEIQINFMNYVTSLGYQALIFLGEAPHPVTNENEKNLDQAKFLIDTLVMLKEKTKGNLNTQEENLLTATVYELQMKFVEINKEGEKHD